MVWLRQIVVAVARSVLALARAESLWLTVASRRFWAAATAAVELEPEFVEPEDLAVPVVPPVPAVVLALVAADVLLPVVLPVPALLVLPLVAVDVAETWPDCACTRVSSVLATCAWAVARAYFNEVASKVARTWPLVTLSPKCTGTVATVPDTAKDTVAEVEGSVVPVACRVCTTGCGPTAAVT